MATLNLPNFTLGISMWYLDPPTQPSVPQVVLNPIQSIETLSRLHPGPSKTHPISKPAPPPPNNTWGKATKAMTEPRPAPPYALYDIKVHATQNCLDLPIVCTHMDDMDTSNGTPVVIVPDPSTVKNKSLQTNHPYAVYSLYVHYSHHFLDFFEYQSTLCNLRKHSH